MLRFKWRKDNEKYWNLVDQRIRVLGDSLAGYRGNHMKVLVSGPWGAYQFAELDVIHAANLVAATRDDEAVEWFHEALDLFDITVTAQKHERCQEPLPEQMFDLYVASYATHVADWAVHGMKDIKWLRRALSFYEQSLALWGDEVVPNPESDARHDVFVSALVEAEDRESALEWYNRLHPEHPSIEGMCALGTPGSLACALMLAEDAEDDDVRASVGRSYEEFLARVIRYDKNGPCWPFGAFDFTRLQYFRHKYIERDNPSVFQLIREARGV